MRLEIALLVLFDMISFFCLSWGRAMSRLGRNGNRCFGYDYVLALCGGWTILQLFLIYACSLSTYVLCLSWPAFWSSASMSFQLLTSTPFGFQEDLWPPSSPSPGGAAGGIKIERNKGLGGGVEDWMMWNISGLSNEVWSCEREISLRWICFIGLMDLVRLYGKVWEGEEVGSICLFFSLS